MKKYMLFLAAGILLAPLSSAQKQKFPYQDASLPVETRVQDLLSRMSVEEKIRQMDMYKGENFKTNQSFDKKKASKTIGALGAVGAIHDLYPENAKMINDLQAFVIRSNRWGIPALIMCEMLHGYYGKGGTAFPMSIGLGATWDTDLIYKVGAAIASEGRALGVHFGLGPVLDIGREPRWGRVAETFSEDTYLASELGSSFISGMKGKSPAENTSMISEPKHFGVHSYPEAGGNSAPVLLGERTARQDFLPVFQKAVTKAGALGVMAAYTELDGVPCTANKWLLTDVLRNEWGFKGIVVSDLGAVRFLETTHYVSDSHKESIRQAITAGLDMQFYDFPNEEWQGTILELYKEGKLTDAHINRAAGGVLRLKFLLGLFENPYTKQEFIDSRFHSKENQDLALLAGQKSICLLKNDHNLLPLSKNLKTIALIGPNANVAQLGGYSTQEKVGKTVLEGLKEVVSKDTQILYEEGVPLIVRGQVIQNSELWTPDGKQNGLIGEYFNNKEVSGQPVLTRLDNQLEFDWPWSPGPGVNVIDFSVRWTGILKPTQSFEGWIGLSADDGIRLWINDEKVIDTWERGPVNIIRHPMKFEKGTPYKLRIEMWEGAWGARAHLLWNLKNTDFTPAIEAAKKADVAIVVVGESRELVEENRDVATLDLHGEQENLIKAIVATGTPVVCVLINGRPLSVNWPAANVPALVEGWFPGEAGGRAVADVLFGNYNPAGRLPITFPKSVGQLPIYYNQKPSKNHKYVTEDMNPLFPFGYGLSYTRFEYGEPSVTPKAVKPDGMVTISVNVKNAGDRDGEEVVQLYVNDKYSSVTTPRQALKGFKRLMIKKGETARVEFKLPADELAIWNREMKRVVEPGEFEAMVGGSLATTKKTAFSVVD